MQSSNGPAFEGEIPAFEGHIPVFDSQTAAFDRHMMAIALTMARRGLGRTAPNPAVGAVIADERTGEVIARAVTAPGGRPHAETQAIEQAGARARGATIYVTLEPCSHHGQTGPCADAIIAAGLSRVVAGIEDPDPRVAGRGLDRLRAAGIAVTRGVLAREARWLTRGHIVRVTERRPFTTLKMALGAGGSIARGHDGQPAWVTGAQARAHGHLLRAEADAILAGAQTVRDDDPELTCRLPGMANRTPIRVVLSNALDLPLTSKLVTSAQNIPLWIVTGSAPGKDRMRALQARGAEILVAPQVGGQLWLPAVMEALVARGVTRLLVEGGPTIWRSFASASLVDEAAVYIAGGHSNSNEGNSGEPALKARIGDCALTLYEHSQLGPDKLWLYRRNG